MVLFALSFQGEVEKYGAYVGIAAFFGLAVLSLLYFSQARELKRLREWAGRAPERARELEQRVVAQAEERRAPAMPAAKGAMAPPRRLAEMPAPQSAAAAATAVGQATEAHDPIKEEEAEGTAPATNGNVPAAGEPAAAEAESGGNGAAPAAADEEKAAEEQPEGEEAPVAEEEAPAAAAPESGDDGAEPGEPAEEAAPPVAAAGAVAAPEPAAQPAAPPPSEAADESEDADEERTVAVPRKTPAQRVGAGERAPAPLPLRQSRPSATPKTGRGAPPRRPAPQGRRPAAAGKPPQGSGRSAGTIALIAGLAVLILGGGAFAISQLGGDEDPPAPNRAAPPPTQTQTGQPENDQAPAREPAETNVAVLNGTTFTGLAGQLADRVQSEGYERGVVETNTQDQSIQTSTVFYADGFRATAREVGELLSIDTIEPLDADRQALAPDADLVVLAGADQAP